MLEQEAQEAYISDLSISPPEEYLEYVMKRKWMVDATCLGVDPELFHPERGESTKEAKDICSICPVQRQCLEYAVQRVEKFGIWGMMSERERRRVRKIRRAKTSKEADSSSDSDIV